MSTARNGSTRHPGAPAAKLPEAFQVSGRLGWFRDPARPSLVHYLPLEPQPEVDSTGAPTLLLLVTGDGGILQFGARLAAEPGELEELRQTLSSEADSNQVEGLVELRPCRLEVRDAALLLSREGAESRLLAQSRTSGAQPFSSLFRLNLDTEVLAGVRAALEGRRRLLHLSYRLGLGTPVTVNLRVAGDAGPALEALSLGAGRSEARLALEAALESGELAMTSELVGPEQASTEQVGTVLEKFLRQAEEEARRAAAEALLALRSGRTAPQSGFSNPWVSSEPTREDRIDIQVRRSMEVTKEIELFTDLADWFAAGASHHIKVVAAPRASVAAAVGADVVEPSNGEIAGSSAVSVRLAFDGAASPIAFIRVSAGARILTLSPPVFEGVHVEIGPGTQELVVDCHFEDGSEAFRTVLPLPRHRALELTPESLGLVPVRIDGTALESAGSRKARVLVRYRGDDGSADQTTLYLDHRSWIATWWLITRASCPAGTLAGSLEVEVKETPAAGVSRHHPALVSTSPELRLEPLPLD